MIFFITLPLKTMDANWFIDYLNFEELKNMQGVPRRIQHHTRKLFTRRENVYIRIKQYAFNKYRMP